MACKMNRRVALCRKLHVLRSLTNSKSVKKSSIITDAFHYISKLRLQVEAIQKQYQYLTDHIIQEVKVEKVMITGTGYLVVRITCKKGDEMLTSVLEAFEEMNVEVVQARFTCKHFFGMEAIVKLAHANIDHIDAHILSQALLNVIRKSQSRDDTNPLHYFLFNHLNTN